MPVSTADVRAPDIRDFDVREFARTAAGCHRDRLDLARYDERPLAQETLRCLRYLRDVERATMRYLRRVLVTPTHKDARITAFLTTWAYEKYWIADALDAILHRHGFVPPPVRGRRSRAVVAWRRAADRFAPLGRALLDNTIGEDVIATHMALGAVDEWLTRAAYQRLGQLEGHAELTRTVATFDEIATRHLAFFEAQAVQRLARSRLARHLTRTRLRRRTWPVSVEDEPPEEDAAFFGRVFASAPALVDDLDARIRALPGLGRLRLVRTTVAASTRRMAH